MNVIQSSYQHVHLQVTWEGTVSWVITACYASPTFVRRQELWDSLLHLANSVTESRVVLGDFNAIPGDHERRGGSQNFSVRGMSGFREMVQGCHLIDAGFQGSPFTWKHGNLYQRLDRVFCNLSLRLKFPSATIFHLPFFKLDHRVVLVQMKKKSLTNRRRRSFRFLAAWLTHEDFPSFMNRTWPRQSSWCSQVKVLHGSLLSWNKCMFGNIFERKRRLTRRLESVANRLMANPSHDLERAQARLWGEYEHVLVQAVSV